MFINIIAGLSFTESKADDWGECRRSLDIGCRRSCCQHNICERKDSVRRVSKRPWLFEDILTMLNLGATIPGHKTMWLRSRGHFQTNLLFSQMSPLNPRFEFLFVLTRSSQLILRYHIFRNTQLSGLYQSSGNQWLYSISINLISNSWILVICKTN